MKITASIVAADPLRLGEEIKRLEQAKVDGIHIDVADGHFVSDIGIGPYLVEALRKATNLPIYVHLMVEEPEKFIDVYSNVGADSIIVHYEACRHLIRTLRRIKNLGKRAGVSILPATAVDVLKDSLKEMDQLLILSNNDSSFLDCQDRKFYMPTLDKLRRTKELKMTLNKNLEVIVDGGVTKELLPKIADAGADTIVSGSALFSQKNMKETVKEFKKVASKK